MGRMSRRCSPCYLRVLTIEKRCPPAEHRGLDAWIGQGARKLLVDYGFDRGLQGRLNVGKAAPISTQLQTGWPRLTLQHTG